MSMFGKAIDLYRNFHKRSPGRGDVVTLDYPETEALLVGELVAVVYKTRERKRAFFHRFDRRPLLLVSADGTQIYIIRGGYRFTSRGFIG